MAIALGQIYRQMKSDQRLGILLLHSQYISKRRRISRQSYKLVDQDPYLKNQDISVSARSGIGFSSVTTVDRENLNNFRSRVTSMTPTEMLRDPNTIVMLLSGLHGVRLWPIATEVF